MIISDLNRFSWSAWNEDEQDAWLFNKFTCTAHEQQAEDGYPRAAGTSARFRPAPGFR